jgi:hypothetical protein
VSGVVWIVSRRAEVARLLWSRAEDVDEAPVVARAGEPRLAGVDAILDPTRIRRVHRVVAAADRRHLIAQRVSSSLPLSLEDRSRQ